jgi:hypothetical protein
MRCDSSLFSLLSGDLFSLTLYFSAAFDVLANFLRLSILAFRVNHFFNFLSRLNPESIGKVYCLESVEAEVTTPSLRAKFQNTATTHKTPRSLGFLFN